MLSSLVREVRMLRRISDYEVDLPRSSTSRIWPNSHSIPLNERVIRTIEVTRKTRAARGTIHPRTTNRNSAPAIDAAYLPPGCDARPLQSNERRVSTRVRTWMSPRSGLRGGAEPAVGGGRGLDLAAGLISTSRGDELDRRADHGNVDISACFTGAEA